MSTIATPAAFTSASLYVGDLLPEVTEQDIHVTFGEIGTIQSIRLCRDAATGRSLGYAYVNFAIPGDAERAKDIKNGALIKGAPCRVCWSVRDSAVRANAKANLFVKNLPESVDVRSLNDLFAQFGNVVSSKVSSDMSGKSRGYGFVHFEDEEVASKLVEKAKAENGLKIAQFNFQIEPFKRADERRSTDDTFTNVYVKNIPASWGMAELSELFKQFGETTSVSVAADEEGKGKGFGFANFANHAHATEAMKGIHGKVLSEGAIPLYACRALSKGDRERQKAQIRERRRQEIQQKSAGCNLYINNLPLNISEEEVRNIFSKFGTITSMKMQRNENGFVGVAFICYANRDEAAKAIAEMTHKNLGPKPLLVTHHQPSETRAQILRSMRIQANFPRGNGMLPPYMQPEHLRRGGPRTNFRRFPNGGVIPGGVRKPRGAGRGMTKNINLANLQPNMLRQTLGEQLYPLVQAALGPEHEKAPKITGMLLEMDATEVMATIENQDELLAKIKEALDVLAASQH